MKNLFILSLFLISISLIINPIFSHKCIHDTLKFKSPLLDSPPPKPKTLPLSLKAVTQSDYKNMRVYADFSCKKFPRYFPRKIIFPSSFDRRKFRITRIYSKPAHAFSHKLFPSRFKSHSSSWPTWYC